MGARSKKQRVDALVRGHIPFARRIAARWFPKTKSQADRDDLVSAALLGLVLAARTFARARGVNFEAYAAQRVRGAVLDYLRGQDPLSRSMRDYRSQIGEAWEDLARHLGRDPTELEMATRLGWTVEKLAATRARSRRVDFVSADEPIAAMQPAPGRGQDELVADHIDCALALRTLDDRRRGFVEAVFLRGTGLRKVGEDVGLTESRMSQLVSESLRMMRVAVSEES